MTWTSLNDLREKFLAFFETKEHLRLPSFPLVPVGDKSLLLINAGMAPLKPYFTGEAIPPRRRITTCQKCIRTLDIDRVGKTARHGTYFEMLGNFSFGDYFKEEAITWAWEFLTQWLEIPADLLYPSIYEGDEEAFEIWHKNIGIPAHKIARLSKEHNFWELGAGPCGPCSEIYFDRGEKYGCGSPDCGPGCDCDRFMEIWNNVFSQFNSDGKGNYAELKQKNIDTGMGLERLACVMQGVDNMFEVDTIRRILDAVCDTAGVRYNADPKKDVSIRVITDHIRSATFLICDGVIPSNEGRGYILRRLLRGAARHGKLLNINRLFLHELCHVVIGENIGAYPELGEKRDYIARVIKTEEERFNATIDAGLAILDELLTATKAAGKTVLSGDDVFKLYDTFGFPIDLTREIAEENKLAIDEARFRELMQAQKERARAARQTGSGWSGESKSLISNLPATEFEGYTAHQAEATVVAIIANDQPVDQIGEGDFTLVLDKTVFYAEGGGQVGDTGTITTPTATVQVVDTKKLNGVYLHFCELSEGSIRVGEKVNLAIDSARRTAIARNHSSAHLLHAALRQVLGAHVEQAGSYVDEHRLRFDFRHFSAVTPEELARIEALVNACILAGADITATETDFETAKQMGAIALFGEKYGATVRVVKMGDYSTELCAGTHLDNTAKAGLFKILSESSVAAGIRRIESTTGLGVLDFLAAKEALIHEAAKELKVNNPADIAKKSAQLQSDVRTLTHALDALKAKLAAYTLASVIETAKPVGNLKLIAAKLDMKLDAVRALCDKIRAERPDTVAVFAVVNDGKLNFTACCGKDAVAGGAHAGVILKQVSAITGGSGGGRPDSAMSGGKDLDKIDEALSAAEGILSAMLKT